MYTILYIHVMWPSLESYVVLNLRILFKFTQYAFRCCTTWVIKRLLLTHFYMHGLFMYCIVFIISPCFSMFFVFNVGLCLWSFCMY